MPIDFAPSLLTALHLALAKFRQHRANAGVLSPFVLPSMLFPVAPWIWSTTTGLSVALVAHACWLMICEILAPSRSPRISQPAASERSRSQSSASSSHFVPPTSSDPARPAGGRGSQTFETTSVLAVLDEAADIKTFRLSRPPGFEFTAGQFIPVRVRVDGKPHVRCYSISSSPDSRGYLEISIRRQGLVSTVLHATLRTGVTVAIGRPAGAFVYPGNDDRPIVLVAGGIGITPLRSMLQYAVSSDPARPVTLLYSARSEQDLAFLNELRTLAERHPDVKVAITLTRPTAPTSWRTGRIDESLLRQYVVHPAHSVFCLCGPEPMIADMRHLLAATGVPEGQIRSEAFDLAAAAPVLTGAAASTRPTGLYERAAEVRRVTFATSGRASFVSASQTLLDAAEAEGIALVSSCRAGVCQTCRTRLVEGEVDCRSDVLDPNDREAGYILPCVSWATTDCVVEA